jgi:putative ABC transport system substrate-binding protein
MSNHLRRREFVAALGAAVLPFAARAQPSMPVVGLLRSTSLSPFEGLGVALRQGLKEVGFIEGQNVAIESRYAENHQERLPALTRELIVRGVSVIVANSVSARAAKSVTSTVPIVFTVGTDPVKEGLVPNLNRPGENMTGVTFLSGVLGTKRLEILRQAVPKAAAIAFIYYPGSVETEAERKDIEAGAAALGIKIIVFPVSNDSQLDPAFAAAAQQGAGAVIVGAGPFMTSKRVQLVTLAARHSLPAIYNLREFAQSGGLMSYGTNQTDAYRQGGIYAGRILKGEKPGDLPVVQAAKFEFVINLKTAKALGLEFHPQFLATADEVVE